MTDSMTDPMTDPMTDHAVLGFIGTGNMGFPMAANLLRAGHEVQVYNRSREKTAPLARQGATVVDTPAQAARGAKLVFSMLANDAAVKAATLGEDGVLAGLAAGAVHVSMSTVSPDTSSELAARHAERGQRYLAAPVFGRPEAARDGKLAICVSGDADARRLAHAVLGVFGQRIEDFGGDPRAANVVKLAGNFMIGAALEAMAEAFALVEKNGIPRKQAADLYGQTLFACPVYQGYGQAIAAHCYEPAGFTVPLGLKDLSLALDTAQRGHVPMPLGDLVRQRLTALVAKGRNEIDWAGLAIEISEAAGLPHP